MDNPKVAEKGEPGFDSLLRQNYLRVSGIFLILMPLQWLAGLVAAWLDTDGWSALIMAGLLGGLMNGSLLWMLRRRPASPVTRHAVGVAQVLISALFVQSMAGRLESQFYVFGSLALVALYLDWRVVVSATAIILIKDLTAGLSWPIVEHTAGVVCEAIVLAWICRQSLEQMRESSRSRAQADIAGAHAEELDSIFASIGIGIFAVDGGGRWLYANSVCLAILGRTMEEVSGLGWLECIAAEDRGRLTGGGLLGFAGHVSTLGKNGGKRDISIRIYRGTGSMLVGTLAEVAERLDSPARITSHILVAEDNLVNQKIARHLLERQGYDVTMAGDGIAAIRLLGEQRFDLCLMDLQMPLMDGLEATAAIRRLETAVQGSLRHMPIVAMTAHAMAADREKCLAAGMDDYISKPVERQDLTRVLDRWLEVKPLTSL